MRENNRFQDLLAFLPIDPTEAVSCWGYLRDIDRTPAQDNERGKYQPPDPRQQRFRAITFWPPASTADYASRPARGRVRADRQLAARIQRANLDSRAIQRQPRDLEDGALRTSSTGSHSNRQSASEAVLTCFESLVQEFKARRLPGSAVSRHGAQARLQDPFRHHIPTFPLRLDTTGELALQPLPPLESLRLQSETVHPPHTLLNNIAHGLRPLMKRRHGRKDDFFIPINPHHIIQMHPRERHRPRNHNQLPPLLHGHIRCPRHQFLPEPRRHGREHLRAARRDDHAAVQKAAAADWRRDVPGGVRPRGQLFDGRRGVVGLQWMGRFVWGFDK